MARYIDADAFKQKLADKDIFFPALYANELNEMPTADVVPKSEVAREIIQDIAKICAVKEFENIDVSIGYASAVNYILKELVAVKRKYEGL
jgi:hypothetical protein